MGNVLRPLWEECPAVTRLLLVTYPALSLALTFVEAATSVPIHRVFACSASAVFGKFRVWTLLLSLLYRPFGGGMAFLMTLMELYMGMVHFPQRERELGSIAFAAWALLANAAANAFYLVMMLALSAIDTGYFFAPNMGMFELLMVIMTLQVLADPGGSSSFWGVAVIPNKWYPLALVGIFSLLNMAIMWNLLGAIAVGYVALKYPALRVDRLVPPQDMIKRAESSCCSNRRALLGGWWVPAGGLSLPGPGGRSSPSPSLFGSGTSGQTQEMQSRSSAASATPKFTAFSGPGQRLGDGSEDAGKPKPVAAPAPAGGVGSLPSSSAQAPASVGREGDGSSVAAEVA